MGTSKGAVGMLAGSLLAGFLAPSSASVVLRGSDPITAFGSLEMSPKVEYLDEHSIFRYTYTLSNYEHNTDSITTVFIDIRQADVDATHAPKTIPNVADFTKYQRFVNMSGWPSHSHRKPGHSLQNVAVKAPYGWQSMPISHGFLQLSAIHREARIEPAVSLQFRLVAYGPPKVTEAIILPSCNGMGRIFRNNDSGCASKQTAAPERHIPTLTPSSVELGSSAHIKQFNEDVGRAYRLFWIKDQKLKKRLRQNLLATRELIEENQAGKAAEKIRKLKASLPRLDESNWTPKGRRLVTANVDAILRVLVSPEGPREDHQ